MTSTLQKNITRSARIKIRATAGGIHLFNRKTGTNVLIDEIRPSPTKISEAPRQVSIALTNACDLSCQYCYAPKFSATISFENLKSWLREFDEHGAVGVGFGGGEPTLHPKFAEICKFATDETNLAVTFTTHAHRLNENLLRALEGNVNFVRVSMDGVDSTYELNRGRSFNELVARIEDLRRIVPFGINYIVNAQTFSDLNAAIELASALEAREFLLLPEQPTISRSGIDEHTEGQLRTWVNDYKGIVRLAVNERNAEGLPTCDPLPLETGLESFVHIDASGTIKRTSYDISGVKIDALGVMSALRTLKKTPLNITK